MASATRWSTTTRSRTPACPPSCTSTPRADTPSACARRSTRSRPGRAWSRRGSGRSGWSRRSRRGACAIARSLLTDRARSHATALPRAIFRRARIVGPRRIDALAVHAPHAGPDLIDAPQQPPAAAADPGLALVRARVHVANGAALELPAHPVLIDLGGGRVAVDVDDPEAPLERERLLDLLERRADVGAHPGTVQRVTCRGDAEAIRPSRGEHDGRVAREVALPHLRVAALERGAHGLGLVLVVLLGLPDAGDRGRENDQHEH